MPARHILIAEDDDASRALLQRYLEANGYRVTTVGDGDAAIAALRPRPVFDLVLLDIMMPRRSGFEVLHAARDSGARMPIIIVTAASSSADIVRALGMGADDYITKPYSFPVLLARIEARLRALGPRRPPTQPPLPPKEESGAEATASRAPAEEELHKDAVAAGLFGRFLAPLGRLKKKLPEPIALGPTSKIAGRYVIQAPLGKGQFGKVYRARHLDLDEPVALKVLTATGSPRAIEIFRSEAQSACRAKHPNAVRVLDFGLLPPESAFLVMELLEGPSLQTVLDLKGRFELEQALTATRAVLSALAMAHKQGLVHRDVKPSNVVLHEEDSRQVPKLIDFGLARGEELWGDAEGGVAGSPAYLAPERIRGLAYDGRADVYACGVMLWKLLTGELPMAELVNDVDALARWHLEVAPPKPSTKVPTLSPAVDAFVLKLLTKDPSKRPAADEAGSLAETALWS